MASRDEARRRAEEALARISKHIIPEPMSGCHLWIGGVAGWGYGSTRIGGRNVRAHRAVWELTKGPIPPGLWVLHHCDNPLCVNPLHLFLGTHSDNMRDLVRKHRHVGQKKLVCKRGHPLSGDNVRVRRGWRACVECQRGWDADYKARRFKSPTQEERAV